MRLHASPLSPQPVSLNTFHTPKPRKELIRLLGWLNDRLVLPRLARIRQIHLPAEDAARLRSALHGPAVICPSHPEFFTDWMLDKWLGSQFDPLTASWADPEIVNGMGAAARRFWLANNFGGGGAWGRAGRGLGLQCGEPCARPSGVDSSGR